MLLNERLKIIVQFLLDLIQIFLRQAIFMILAAIEIAASKIY